MALTMWGQVIIQAATPGEDPVKVGTIWVDISGTPSVKVCTSISPYTFAAISGGVPAAHATSHENGGSDEMSVAGLSGLLADKQTPLPAGSDTQVQFNDGGTLSADSGFSFSKTLKRVLVTLGLGSEATNAGLRVQAYSPAIQLLDKDSVQDWHIGLDDDEQGAFQIGRGYGPGQAVAPSIVIDKTSGAVTVGAVRSASPDAVLNVVSNDGYGDSDWMLWLRRHGTTPVSCHARLQHFSDSGAPENVLSGLAARGTLAAPDPVLSGDNLMIIDGRGFDDSATDYSEYAVGWSDGQATIQLQAAQNWANGAHGSQIKFLTTPNGSVTQAEILRIQQDGVVNLLKGQVQFPASQNPSSDANTLDDYEEGTFTPTDASGAALTFVAPTGSYVKIGKMVFVSINLQFPATADGSAAVIGSLPFTAHNGAPEAAGAMGFTNSALEINLLVTSNTTTVVLTDKSGTTIANSALSNATIRFSAVYRATS